MDVGHGSSWKWHVHAMPGVLMCSGMSNNLLIPDVSCQIYSCVLFVRVVWELIFNCLSSFTATANIIFLNQELFSNNWVIAAFLFPFYARKQNASRVFAIVWASVICPSVRPSVTLLICIKTVQARITKYSLWTASRFLVYRDKISCHWVQGFPLNEGVKEGYPP